MRKSAHFLVVLEVTLLESLKVLIDGFIVTVFFTHSHKVYQYY